MDKLHKILGRFRSIACYKTPVEITNIAISAAPPYITIIGEKTDQTPLVVGTLISYAEELDSNVNVLVVGPIQPAEFDQVIAKYYDKILTSIVVIGTNDELLKQTVNIAIYNYGLHLIRHDKNGYSVAVKTKNKPKSKPVVKTAKRPEKCEYIGDRVEFRAGCGGWMCAHNCDHPDENKRSLHLIAVPGGYCQECPDYPEKEAE